MSASFDTISAHTMTLDKDSSDGGVFSKSLMATMRKQRLQDFLFHKITFIFALSVLFVLLGIIASLMIGAWPVSYTHLTLPTSDLV